MNTGGITYFHGKNLDPEEWSDQLAYLESDWEDLKMLKFIKTYLRGLPLRWYEAIIESETS